MSQETTNDAWLELVRRTMTYGDQIEVRGSKIIELENQSITVDPLWPFITFEARNYKFDYCKKELLWKINADNRDTSIEKYAKMWATVKNDNGTFNSNYGAYWFADQGVGKAIEQLAHDKFSRRATIPMLNASHVGMDVRDTVCTEAMTFLIRKDKLNCHVHMRSSDQVFGLGTDIPSFSMVQRLVYAILKATYPELEMGSLTIVAASSHIYERHFAMCEALRGGKPKVLTMTNDHWMPIPDIREAELILSRYLMGLTDTCLYQLRDPQLSRWLLSGGEL